LESDVFETDWLDEALIKIIITIMLWYRLDVTIPALYFVRNRIPFFEVLHIYLYLS